MGLPETLTGCHYYELLKSMQHFYYSCLYNLRENTISDIANV